KGRTEDTLAGRLFGGLGGGGIERCDLIRATRVLARVGGKRLGLVRARPTERRPEDERGSYHRGEESVAPHDGAGPMKGSCQRAPATIKLRRINRLCHSSREETRTLRAQLMPRGCRSQASSIATIARLARRCPGVDLPHRWRRNGSGVSRPRF